jgi:spore germination protein GerM
MIRLHQRSPSPFTSRPPGAPSVASTAARLVAVLLMAAIAACSPGTGAIGTPATPAVTAEPSIGPSPSDIAPSTAPSPTTSAPPGPSETTPGSAEPTTPTTTPKPTATPAGTSIVRAYFFLGSFTGNEGLAPVLREVPQTKAVAAAAMRALLQGPNADEMAARPAMFSAIPDGTRLNGVSISGGVATVDLSAEFASGGGSASVLGRLAQVVYTLTQFSTVDEVRFELDGTPVDVFSAEGIVLDHPVGRGGFQDQLPAIFVDRPAWGASIGNPGRVSGIANVFEATFRVALLNANGKLLVDEQVMASCGTGCWGSFRTDLSYSVSKAQYGTLRVFDLSAKDGKPENATEYKVWLTPPA